MGADFIEIATSVMLGKGVPKIVDDLDLGLDGPRSWPSGSWASEWLGATADSAAAGGLAAERDRVAGRVLGLHLR